jgi:gamma-glutamyltranspeptidase / glutathione hydrolase
MNMRDFHVPGRSPVFAANAMAATSMPQATLTAIEVLKAGGNALDAAIAAAAVLSVIEPQSTGIGGDCFCLYAPAGSKKIIAMNGSGRAPASLSLDALETKGITELEKTSAHAVTIPGAVSAWETLLAAHGSKGLDELLQPAINYAANGFVVAPRVAADWAEVSDKLQQTKAEGLLVNGCAPVPGTIFRQKQLAETLRSIAKYGARAFYEGDIAASLVRTLRERGGLHDENDFAAGLKGAEFVNPISGKFAGHDVWECPPNGSGIVALMLMGIMDGFPASSDPLDLLRLHRHVEAARLVYRDRDAFVADPSQSEVPVSHLLSPEYLGALRNLIDDTRALPTLPPAGKPHMDTVYLSVVDAQGNVCSFINSLYESFGSGIWDPQTGVVLHNRGLGFQLERGHPNCIAPNKRPMHTIIPAMTTKDGEPQIVFGVMGGHFQPMGQSWVLANILQYGLDPQAAIDLPRLFPALGVVNTESGIPQSTRDALAALGHRIHVPERPHGGGQAIVIDRANGVLIGGSDPRKDGCALGY